MLSYILRSAVVVLWSASIHTYRVVLRGLSEFSPIVSTTTLFPLFLYLFQPAQNRFNPHPQQSAVGFELSFTRASQANTTFLAFQMGPAPDQTRRQVPQLGQLNL